MSVFDEWCERRNYVQPEVGDLVLRYDPKWIHGDREGLLYHVDAYAGGLPRGHVVFDDGSELHDVLFMFQRAEDALFDPTWWE